jgi:C4-dicarboxylate-specific signal transduction histidine kinase
MNPPGRPKGESRARSARAVPTKRLRPGTRTPGLPCPDTVLDALPVAVAIVDARGQIIAANPAMAARASAAAGSFAARFPDYHAVLAGDFTTPRELDVVRATNGSAVRERLAVRRSGADAIVTVLDDLPGADPQTTRLASLGFMVAGVCHEVSNPLAAIHSMVQILQSKRGASPEIFERGLASISSNIARVLGITRTLTDFSRVNDDPMRSVALSQVVEEAASLLKHRTGPNAILLDVAVADDALVRARSGELEQVVFNILLNAAQAMDGRGRVTVAGARHGARVRLAIRDEGPGIAAENLGRIFEPFFTTKNGAGAGLGLAISSEIVHELGGDLRAENDPGAGACFRIDLPAAAS